MHITDLPIALVLAVFVATGCGGEAETPEDARAEAAPAGGLTAEQLENGIGPVSELELDALDAALAARGQEVFTLKCSACHKPDERYVGPALGDVTTRRTPEYVMNMILNPQEMVDRHPDVKAMLGDYYTPMPNLGLDETRVPDAEERVRQLANASPVTSLVATTGIALLLTSLESILFQVKARPFPRLVNGAPGGFKIGPFCFSHVSTNRRCICATAGPSMRKCVSRQCCGSSALPSHWSSSHPTKP